ncbi:AMIN domain-containing protein [Candidatus Electrothrix aarhusensis]|uniref:AMIN domain-containing protein n=1 Tax=Candidatus Electrothrix aarhusensis TaxID=1859131 RepID=A0A444IWH6_9BACT|nr:AMIN domain-containing protein [Candidatus Electrothrix aarhusensis]
MLKNISAVTFALVFLLFYGWQAMAAQKVIEDINFESPGNGEERIVFKLNGTYIPKIFTLQGKQPRVVFDFQDTTAAKMINNIINTNGELIKRIRVGIHKGDNPKTRVVLDLRPNKNINIQQDFDKKEKALVVSIHYAGSKKQTDKQKPDEQTVPAPGEQQDETENTTAVVPPVQPEKKQASGVVKAEPKPVTQAEKKSPAKQEKKRQAVKAAVQTPTKKAEKKANIEKNPGMPILTSITFDNDSNRGEMVLFKLNEFHPPIVFGIEEGRPRVVCDFKDTAVAKDIPESLKTAGKYIQTIRVGNNKGEKKVRVVLDLVPNYSYDLQQVFFKEENLFVIIINTLGNAPTGDPSELLK